MSDPSDKTAAAPAAPSHDATETLFEEHRHTSAKNLFNAFLCAAVLLPSILLCAYLFSRYPQGISEPGWLAWLYRLAIDEPIWMVNLLFLGNVCVLFWVLNLVQRSTWLIDPYWTLLPPLMGHFFAAHPLANGDPTRSALALGVTWVWSIRLTYSYFRRERFKFGVREDWRFAVKRGESRHFWWYSFFYVYAAQQVMLVGLSLPLWAVHFRSQPLGPLDIVLAAAALAGIVTAGVADTQLERFMKQNRERSARGEPKVRLLETGLWRYSRHPNYFGEQLFWWSLAAIGAALGEPWVMAGTLVNSIVLAVVTVMTERRMLAVPERRQLYEDYRKRVSVWIPWFRRKT